MSERGASSAVRDWLDIVDRALASDRSRVQLVAGFAAFTVLATAAAGLLVGPAVGVLVLAAGALFGAIGLFWASLRALFGETKLTPEDAFAIGAPSVEEEQKRAVLRAIKDLEFEHAVGKISKQDHATLLAKYRNEAKRLLRLIEAKAQPERDAVEHLVKAHLATKGFDRDQEPVESGEKARTETLDAKKDEDKDEEKKPEAIEDDEPAADTACPECATENDVDAVFCKKCGTRLGEEDE